MVSGAYFSLMKICQSRCDSMISFIGQEFFHRCKTNVLSGRPIKLWDPKLASHLKFLATHLKFRAIEKQLITAEYHAYKITHDYIMRPTKKLSFYF